MLACAASTPVLSSNITGLCGSQIYSGHDAGHGVDNITGVSHMYAIRKQFVLGVVPILRAAAVYCVVSRPVPCRFVTAAATVYLY